MHGDINSLSGLQVKCELKMDFALPRSFLKWFNDFAPDDSFVFLSYDLGLFT